MQDVTETLTKTLLAEYAYAVASGDALAVARFYSSDAVIYVSGAVWARGQGEICQQMQSDFAATDLSPQVVTREIVLDQNGLCGVVRESFRDADGSTGYALLWVGIESDRLCILEKWILYTTAK